MEVESMKINGDTLNWLKAIVVFITIGGAVFTMSANYAGKASKEGLRCVDEKVVDLESEQELIKLKAEMNYQYIAEKLETIDKRQERIEKKLDRVQKLEIALGIARALDQVHRAGYVYRDMKPENVIVHRDEADNILSVRLIDLGVVEKVGSDGLHRDPPGAIFGTPLYLSPDQVAHPFPDFFSAYRYEGISQKSDLYGLALTIFTLWTGETLLNENASLQEIFGWILPEALTRRW